MTIDQQYWLAKWKANDIGFHESTVTPELVAYFHRLQLQPGQTVFVPLCGKSVDMLWLADQGLRVVGVELSQIACEDFFSALRLAPIISRQGSFTKYQHDNIEILCGDIYHLTPSDLGVCHAVYDSKALIALPPEMRDSYVKCILSCTNQSVRVLLITRESPCRVMPPPFPVFKEEVETLFLPNFSVQSLHRELLADIHERLIKKGYMEMTLCVYLIYPK